VDHHYNRPRPADDVVNYALGPAWGEPVYGSPLIHTGGNFMGDGHGYGFSTTMVYDENPSLTPAQVNAYMSSYLGISTYRTILDVNTGGIHHIDCWAKLLDERTILVKQLPAGHASYARTEANVATMRTWTNAYGEPYRIVRVYCPYGAGDVAAYTNAVILNKKVLVPTFGLTPGDDNALQVYRDAMPGYEVLGFSYSGSYSFLSDDAIHCRVMGIHDKYMLRVDVAPLPDTVWTTQDIRLGAVVDDRSEAGLKADSVRVYWRISGQPTFSSVSMTAAAYPDSFYGYVPLQAAGTRIDYYVFAADNTNRRSTRPPVAPDGFYSFVVGQDPADAPEVEIARDFGISTNWPNPFQAGTEINFRLPAEGPVRVTVVDVQGRQVAQLVNETLTPGGYSAHWDGRNIQGDEVAEGMYFIRLTAGDRVDVRRVVKLN
jgi:agmatine deiminase